MTSFFINFNFYLLNMLTRSAPNIQFYIDFILLQSYRGTREKMV